MKTFLIIASLAISFAKIVSNDTNFLSNLTTDELKTSSLEEYLSLNFEYSDNDEESNGFSNRQKLVSRMFASTAKKPIQKTVL